MAPVRLDSHVGGRPNPLYNKGSLVRLFNSQQSDNAQTQAIGAGYQIYPKPELPKDPLSLNCDVALGCGSQESHSRKSRARSRAVDSPFENDSRIHAPKNSKQKQELSLIDDGTPLKEVEGQDISPFERDRRIHASKTGKHKQELSLSHMDDATYPGNDENEQQDEDDIVYRVCQYSTGSRYGYLIDHCPEHRHSAPSAPPPPSRPHSISGARQVQSRQEKPPGVHVDLTLGTVTLILVFLLLVAIMLVEIVDIVADARTSSSEGERRGRSRTRRVLARAFGAPRNLFVNNPGNEKEALGLGALLKR